MSFLKVFCIIFSRAFSFSSIRGPILEKLAPSDYDARESFSL
jgi:hypothetical protein